jgi:hypothetical protein
MKGSEFVKESLGLLTDGTASEKVVMVVMTD